MRAVSLAQHLERAAKVLRLFVGLLAFLPGEENDMTRPRQRIVGDDLNDLAVRPRNRGRGEDRATLAKRGEPCELRGNFVPGVIALSVYSKGPPLAAGRHIDTVGRVLGDVDEVRSGVGGKVVVAEGRGREPVQPPEPVGVRQRVET